LRESTMVANILDWYSESSVENREAAAWYGRGRAHARRIARSTGVTEARAAGVVAALSPRTQWSVNLRWAEGLLRAAQAGDRHPPLVGFGSSRIKAWRIAQGERPLDVLSGPKVRAFYRNLTGDLEHVTVDVWAMRAAGFQGSLKGREYDAVASAYREAARILRLRPAELQAIVWVAIRGRSN
jgi:hypothetical protein